jgi:acylphosphatase
MVQGVGFRYTARRLAQRYEVGGWVRNLDDGRVELVIEGASAAVAGALEALEREMGRYIVGTEAAEEPPRGEFHAFSVRQDGF